VTQTHCPIPANPYECFEFAVQAFDLAERFQTPVFMLSDLDIGMNDWVVPELHWNDDYVWDRGPVLNDEDLARMSEFFRYNSANDDSLLLARCPARRKRCVLHPRLGHDQFGRYTRTAGVSRGRRPPEEEARRLGRAVPAR